MLPSLAPAFEPSQSHPAQSGLPALAPVLRPVQTKPPLSLKRKLVRAIHLFSYRSGLTGLYARYKQDSVAAILMYHSIPEPLEAQWMDPRNCHSPEIFEAQMRFLAEHRSVVSLDQLLTKIDKGESISPGTVAITLDDGYLNNLTVAAPILAKYGLPATLYLATAYINEAKNQWIDTLYSYFRARSQHHLALPTLGDWNLEDDAQRLTAYRTLTQVLIAADPSQREQWLAVVEQQLAPTALPPRLTMTWDDVRALHQQYPNITLGVHTANHLDLQTHPDKAAEEMELSLTQLAREVGLRSEHFSFPYNRYCPQAQQQVIAAKMRSAVAVAQDPVVRLGTSPYALPRLEAPQSLTMLKSWTDGGFPDVTQRLFGRVWTQA